MRLLPENAKMDAHSIKYKDQEIDCMSENIFRKDVLWTQISLVPQSAMNSLNPVYKVGEQIVEAIQTHTPQGKKKPENELKNYSTWLAFKVNLWIVSHMSFLGA